MEAYSWPGNVRELKNVIERAMILSAKDAIGAEDLSLSKIAPALSAPVIEGKTLNLDETEKVLIERALEQSGENQSDRKSTRLNYSHIPLSRMPSSA